MDTTMTSEQRELLAAGDRFLREAGFRWDGRKTKEVSSQQAAFERRQIRTPTGGKRGTH